jgi:transcriptional regulator with XRE-family HTH domain
MKTSGELLKDYRKSKNITQDQLAEMTGYSKSYISLLESSQRPLTDDAMYKIMKHLRVSMIEIAKLKHVRVLEEPSITFNTESLKPHQKALVLAFVKSINKLSKGKCDEILEKIRNQ